MRSSLFPARMALLLVAGIAAPAGGADSLTLTSAAILPGRTVPAKFTCQGADVSPPLGWSGAPDATKTYALIVDDPDAPAGTWVHWVLFNIPAAMTSLPEGVPASEQLADGSRNGRNDFKRLGYNGPCPPPGPPHRYYFKLFALDRTLDLTAGATKADLERTMAGHVLGRAELMVTYQR